MALRDSPGGFLLWAVAAEEPAQARFVAHATLAEAPQDSSRLQGCHHLQELQLKLPKLTSEKAQNPQANFYQELGH